MAPRSRIEDLGRIAERLSDLCAQIKTLMILAKTYVESTNLESTNLELICEIDESLKFISHELNEVWYIARFGYDEDEDEPIFPTDK